MMLQYFSKNYLIPVDIKVKGVVMVLKISKKFKNPIN